MCSDFIDDAARQRGAEAAAVPAAGARTQQCYGNLASVVHVCFASAPELLITLIDTS